MPLHQTRPATRLRAMLLVLASGCLLISSDVGVRAADDNGLDFFRHFFGAPAPAPVAAAPVAQPYDAPVRRRWAARNRLPPHARAALRSRTRYVALPKPEKVESPKAVAVAKPPPSGPFDARAALLRDPTLRPGDIVILPEGPRVFRGDPDAQRHRMSDFEDVRRPGAVASSTRRELLAMTAPVGAMPAETARRMMARSQKAVPAPDAAPDTAPVAARSEASLTRVVYPVR
ncbi:hypothetical protein OPKNFCMD_5205 [Methylobacterium crusticola]|uniref:Uncharacterized protein n=1 Tax=Methylobacterium crusticola TaxID=1697972 RepID=A0ABQ4R433_9HYPH|nr:hypothetical protein [Methylobacterium crusticola]GJD52440.1 hypothetical protein OPKNFCMD_5205 [Methylobacterium crusticola]